MFARMEKAADSQKQQEAVPTRRPPENPMPVRSFYSVNPQNAPIQMLRKKVADKGDIPHSVYWDKRVGKYYTGMKRVSNLAVYSAVWGKTFGKLPRRLPQAVDECKYLEDENKFLEPASEKKYTGLFHRLTELDGGFFTPIGVKDPHVFDKGTEVPSNRVFAMRFYAEGDMRHATGVARGLQSGTARASHTNYGLSPLPLPGLVRRGVFTPDHDVEVTVKATEYRTLDEMRGVYGFTAEDNPVAYAEGLKNFEGSFGGRTGDMTRTPSAGFKRRYNLIQATFFWIPKTDIPGCRELFHIKDQLRLKLFCRDGSPRKTANREAKLAKYKGVSREIENCELTVNKDMFENFLLNKAQKLTDNGELRVVVAGGDIYVGAVKRAADKASVELKDYIKNYIDLRYPKKYSSELDAAGWNAGEQFKHTRTANADEVPATTKYGDVIYVFRRKSPRIRTPLPPPPKPSASKSQSK